MSLRFVAISFLVLVLCACQNNQTQELSPEASANIVQMQSEFFPMTVGSEWTYEVTIKDLGYTYDEVNWPIGNDQSLVYATTGFLHKDNNKSLLTLKVDSEAEKQGPFSYPNGVLVSAIRDDAGVYRDTKNIYFNTTTDLNGTIQVQLVTTYDWINSPTQMSASDGYAVREIFFSVDASTIQYALTHPGENKPLVRMSLNDSQDSLSFVGFDTISGYENSAAMHFVRLIEPQDAQTVGFTEDFWFVGQVGLVRLVQKQNEVETMRWELIKPNA